MNNIEKINGNIGVKIRNEFNTIDVLTMINGFQWSSFQANIDLLVMLRSAIDEYVVQHGNIEDIKTNHDFRFSYSIKNMLKESGYVISSIATDEDGHEHKITFSNGYNSGEIHTENGKIVIIEGAMQ